jgi:hypothetical protein
MREWSKSDLFVPAAALMASMHFWAERFLAGRRRNACARARPARVESTNQMRSEVAADRACKAMCDKASPGVVVVLHLRFCYVSKAAILTVPVQSVSVENRSPA